MTQLVFIIPLLLGILMTIGIAFGGGVDCDGDGALDIFDSHVGSGHAHDAITVLSFGRTPFFMRAAIFLLVFGGSGVCCGFFSQPLLISLLIAGLSGFLLTTTVAHLLGRYIPTLETNSVTCETLVGLSGTVELPPDDGMGVVTVLHGNDRHTICIRSDEVVEKGDAVLILSVDTDGVYVVCADMAK
jgi:membrane protein implicated in regulation of membrane protease activity